MNINSYPHVYNLGHKAIAELFLDPVLIEEKIDGSQFSMGVYEGKLKCRSKNTLLDLDYPNDMFAKAVEIAKTLASLLHPDWTYRGEYLRIPKHNTINYDRIPKNHIILFDINDGLESYLDYEAKKQEAERIGLEVVPQIALEKIDSLDSFKALLSTISCLGGTPIEGVVIKNYKRFGIDGKVLMGKFVSEKFKEKNDSEWKSAKSSSEIRIAIADWLRTEARWQKSIIHLREQGQITDSPKDIGPLLKEINKDILEECGEEIKERLFKWAWKDIISRVTKDFPLWYKEQLLKKQFGEDVKILERSENEPS